MNRAFSAGVWNLPPILGRCPRLKIEEAVPLARNINMRLRIIDSTGTKARSYKSFSAALRTESTSETDITSTPL
jgi:hypothetical protein